MNHFLHLLILFPALFITIIALPTTFFDDTFNSWTDPTLDNVDTLLADNFDGPSTSSELVSQGTPASSSPTKQPAEKIQHQEPKPLFLCCTSIRPWVDDPEEKQCRITTRDDNDVNCTWGKGEARYCARGISTSVITDCYRYKTGT